jgi:glycosyltransferase 2 family protein
MPDRPGLPSRAAPTTRSPIHLLTLLAGLVLVSVGWAIATLLENGVIALTRDAVDVIRLFPAWVEPLPSTIVDIGALAVTVGVVAWLVTARRWRELVMLVVGMAVAAVVSRFVGEAVLWVSRPEVRAVFDELPSEVTRRGPTDSAVAAVSAALALTRQWIPSTSRRLVLALYLGWLVASIITVTAPPHLGLVLDIGIGLVAGSAVALVAGTPSLQPGRDQLVEGLARSGVEIASLDRADVDARGSTPWEGVTTEGDHVFVKAFSVEQRAADLLYRALRWLQLRRSGDRAPEMSLKRSAEHEALVSHHVQAFGLPAPRLLAVADLGDNTVALAYERLKGCSLDQADADDVTDDVLAQLWSHLALLRRHGIAHRDLRLANAFLREDGQVALVDFGFAELAADPGLLDADVAELLAATACAVGVDRAVSAAHAALGADGLEGARDWLQPLALSAATRSQLAEDATLEELRTAVETVTGLPAAPHEPIGRMSLQRIVGVLLLAVGAYSVLSVVAGADWSERMSDLRWDLLATALALTIVSQVFVGASAHTMSRRRISNRAAAITGLATMLPAPSITPWAWAHEELTQAARRIGIYSTRSHALASAWVLTGAATAPLVVAVFAGAGLRGDHTLTVSALLGTGAGMAVAGAQIAVLLATPWGRDLRRVWTAQEPRTAVTNTGVAAGAAWWIAARSTHGLGAALAMRAVGVDAPLELLVAVSVTATTLAALTPVPGGIGANEAVLYGLLVAIGEPELAGAGMVTARIVGFWSLLPAAWLAHRILHDPDRRGSRLGGWRRDRGRQR